MSDLTTEVLAELERLEREATSSHFVASYFTRPNGEPITTVEHVVESMAESARHEQGKPELFGVSVYDPVVGDNPVVCYTGNGPTSKANAIFLAAIRDHASALIEAARERDRLRTILAEARAWIASEAEGASGRYASSLVGDIDAALERKDGNQCSTQQS